MMWILGYPPAMSTSPSLRLALCALTFGLVLGCGDAISIGQAPGTGGTAGAAGSGATGGSGGAAGTGGMDGSDAGVSCSEVGCDDGNACTLDGVCNTVMGVCLGGGSNLPADTLCTQDGGFVCDGAGSCVVCNDDEQCVRFFPPQDCREPATCNNNDCPVPEAFLDGTPCSTGVCYQGSCVALLPQRKLVPMVCDNPVSFFDWEIPIDMTVAPSAIEAARNFTADIHPTLSVPRQFLQGGLIAVFPTELTSLSIVSAGAEIVTDGVLTGSPVSTSRRSAPVTVPIPQTANPGDPGGSACTTDADCPLAAFSQNCNAGGQCDCACQAGCAPATCANLVTGDVPVPLPPLFNVLYRAEVSGEVCFDVGGENPPSAIGAPPVRTGIRAVASNGAFVRFECVGGTLNDNGTPALPADDFVDPNPPSSQICFPIDTPDVDLCAGPPQVDCADDKQCAVDDVCDPFTGSCVGGRNEPRGTPCAQDGGTVCDGQGSCVECVQSSGCPDDGNQCTQPPSCLDEMCQPQDNEPAGALCDQDGGNRCDGNGTCVDLGDGLIPQTKAITFGCTSNLTADVSILPFELTVAPQAPVSGQAFAADLSGLGTFSEELLDSVQWVIPGGVTRVNLIDIAATVQVRVGASGGDVTLGPVPVPNRCALDQMASCDPANDLPSIPGSTGNSDCLPTGPSNPCGRFLSIPTSDDCTPGGICATLGGGTSAKVNQCRTNGFCVTGDLQVPLESRVGNYVAGVSPAVLFGWDDSATGATLNADGTWNLPPAVFSDPIGSNGIRAGVGGLSVALECTMGVDSDGIYGVGIPAQSSPTPNALLIAFPVQTPP
jgi:hypothetical protein